MNADFEQKIALLQQQHEVLLQRLNFPVEETNGIVRRYTYPIVTREHIPLEWRYDFNPAETNVYDMRLTAHEDGWIYGIFCSERHDDSAPAGDLSSAVAKAGIVRTRNLVDWERLPDLKSGSQQRNVVLHPEFVNGKYALYTRPQDDFINAGNGGGIGWALIDDMTQAEVKEEMGCVPVLPDYAMCFTFI